MLIGLNNIVTQITSSMTADNNSNIPNELSKTLDSSHMFTMLIPTISFALLICWIEIPNIVGAGVNDPQTKDRAASHNWLVTRDMWLARAHNNTEKIYGLLPLVVIQHTVSARCNNFVQCAAQMRNLQSYFLNTLNNDIPYNFIIGNDGKVYEGRGWNKVGGHTWGYNHCSLGLAFVGDYRENIPGSTKVTALQEARAQMLFLEGIRLGHLRPNFHVLGAMDLMSTLSPGENLQRAIKNWPNYDHQNRYKNRNCDEIIKLD